MLKISVAYNEDFPLHGDLAMDFDEANLHVRTDLYWFALDNHYLPGQESFSKAVKVLHILLEHWYETISRLQDKRETHLLFEVVDEYVGCLWINRIGDELEIRYGFEYGASAPSGFAHEILVTGKFEFTSASSRVPLTWFLKEIERERNKIGAMAEEEKSKPPLQEDQPHVERFSAMGGEIYLEFEGDIALAINGYYGEDQIFRLVEPTGRADKAMRRAEGFLEEWFGSQRLLRRFE